MADQPVPLATIAKFLDLTERRVNQLVNEKVLPRSERGKYPFLAVVKAYIKYLRARADGGSISLTDERTRLARIKVEVEQVGLDRLKGNLLDRAETVQEQVLREIEFKTALLPIGRDLAPKLIGKGIREIDAIITEKVHNVLRRLARKET